MKTAELINRSGSAASYIACLTTALLITEACEGNCPWWYPFLPIPGLFAVVWALLAVEGSWLIYQAKRQVRRDSGKT